jgi:hypothetical protein
MTAPPTVHDLLDTLTHALRKDGWAPAESQAPSAAPDHARARDLTDPWGLLGVSVCAHPRTGQLTSSLYQFAEPGPATGPPRARDWTARTDALAPPVIIAAARAAITTVFTSHPLSAVHDLLAQAGWHLDRTITEKGRVLEECWSDPAETRTLSYVPPHEPFDGGGWLLTRPDQDQPRAEFDLPVTVPHAVIAALALT